MKMYSEGYLYKMEREILEEQNAIQEMYDDVEERIVSGDLNGLAEEFKKLFERQQNFESFKKERLDKIGEYISQNITAIVDTINREDIRDEYGFALKTGFCLSLLNSCIQKEYNQLTKGWSTGPNFALLLCNEKGRKHLDFVVELYKYNGDKLSELYNEKAFNQLPEELKIQIFKDMISEVQSAIKYKSSHSDYLFQKFSNILDDDDIKNASKKYPKIYDLANRTSDMLDKAYPVSNDVFEEESQKAPKEMRESVRKFVNTFKGCTEIEKDDLLK